MTLPGNYRVSREPGKRDVVNTPGEAATWFKDVSRGWLAV